jgi:2-phospho-L-lactate guanylyltransferase (CobY/MobA/RfbA family)
VPLSSREGRIGLDSLLSVATIVIPFRRMPGKTRLAPLPAAARAELAVAMLADVRAACAAVGPTLLAEAPGGQARAVAAALRGVRGPVVIVNADLACATRVDVERLIAATPALVAAADGTTNALALGDPRAFRPLYGAGSAERFAALGLTCVDIPNLAEDVDTLADLERLADRVGQRTRAALEALRTTA